MYENIGRSLDFSLYSSSSSVFNKSEEVFWVQPLHHILVHIQMGVFLAFLSFISLLTTSLDSYAENYFVSIQLNSSSSVIPLSLCTASYTTKILCVYFSVGW